MQQCVLQFSAQLVQQGCRVGTNVIFLPTVRFTTKLPLHLAILLTASRLSALGQDHILKQPSCHAARNYVSRDGFSCRIGTSDCDLQGTWRLFGSPGLDSGSTRGLFRESLSPRFRDPYRNDFGEISTHYVACLGVVQLFFSQQWVFCRTCADFSCSSVKSHLEHA